MILLLFSHADFLIKVAMRLSSWITKDMFKLCILTKSSFGSQAYSGYTIARVGYNSCFSVLFELVKLKVFVNQLI